MTGFGLMLIALGVLAQGRRVPRQMYYDTKPPHSGILRVPLAHAPLVSDAVCRLVPSAGQKVAGDIVLRQRNVEDPVEIIGSITGLLPGYHGFHIHQNANLSDNCKAAGPHFNPENHSHGAPQDPVRHAGDLGNISADENGNSAFQILDQRISLFDDHPYQVLGRAIVVHQKEDDLGRGNDEESKKTGNAGARIACCVIERQNFYPYV